MINRERFSKINCFEELGNVKEEVDFFKNRPVEDQKGFFILRVHSLATHKKIVGAIFDKFLGDKLMGGIEFGCGALSIFYNLLVPHQFKRNWKQYDINPSFVEYNRCFTKRVFRDKKASVQIGNIYDMPLEDNSVNLIVGLSAWDSVSHFDVALGEVYRCLSRGVFFIHLQDILPANYPILMAELMKREERKLPLEFDCEYHVNIKTPIQGFTTRERFLVGLESVDESKLIHSGRYLTNHLAAVIKEFGFSVLLNDEVSHTTIQKRRYYSKPMRKLGLRPDPRFNVFETASYLGNVMSYDSSVPWRCVRLRSSIDVLVAQKD